MFQSTRPHGARQKPMKYGPDMTAVSIHAPAWGATINFGETYPDMGVSIHAPAWGAT